MAENVIPLTGLDQIGLIKDTPMTALPPAAFSEARNVRFRDGAAQKMEGEVNLFPDALDTDGTTFNYFLDTDNIVKYVAWWANPNRVGEYKGYYLVIAQKFDTESNRQRDFAYLVDPEGAISEKGKFEPDDQGNWQHTFFQGGYALIINNGQDKPHYILDPEGNTDMDAVPDFAVLPGWDSYNVTQIILDDIFEEGNSRTFDLGQTVDFTIDQLYVEEVAADNTVTQYTAVAGTPAGTGTPNASGFMPGNLPATVPQVTTSENFAIYLDTESNTTVLQLSNASVTAGKRIRVVIRSREVAAVRAGVIRTFGDFLVAGNLVEVAENDPDVVLRSLPGTVRTSDAAAPGAVPNNWDPFAAGVSTANEFTTTQSGIIQDMVQLQGQLYIYSNDAIYVMPNPAGGVPQQPQPVSEGWGAQTTNAVIEFDGQHFVVGAQDIYLFSGHPGNIQSVADGRVRDYFYDRLNPLHEQRMFCLRYRQKDEIWICYPTASSVTGECDEALIWNYRKNNWTTRDIYNVVSGDVGPVPGGGVPSQLIHLMGDSGDNGYISIGAVEVQSLSLPSSYELIGNTVGHAAEYTITVDTDVAAYNRTGLPIVGVNVSGDFNTGTTDPVYILFQGIDADNRFTFNFEIQLPDNTIGKEGLIAALEANSDFTTHLDIEDSTDPNNFVIDVKTPNTVSATFIPGTQVLFDRADLDSDIACDITNGGQQLTDDTDNYYREVTTIYVPPNCVGNYFYLDILDSDGNVDTAAPADRRLFIIPDVGINQDFYDVTVDSDSLEMTNYMYGDTWTTDLDGARGGITGRPVRSDRNEPNVNYGTNATGSPNVNQFMFRARSNDAEDFEVEIPWIPTRAGLYDISIWVSDTETYTWSSRNWVLRSYTAPSLNSNFAGDLSFAEDPRRFNFTDEQVAAAIAAQVATAPPVISIRNGRLEYNPGTDTDVENSSSTFVTTATFALGGNFADLTGAQRAEQIAAHISDAMHDTDFDHHASFFDASRSGRVVTLTSREIGRHFVGNQFLPNNLDAAVHGTRGNHVFIQDFGTGLSADSFDIALVNRGRWTLEQDYAGTQTGLIRPLIYPKVVVSLANDNGMVYYGSDSGIPEGGVPTQLRNENIDKTQAVTAEQILDQCIVTAFNGINVDGWSASNLPSGYSQPTGVSHKLVAATARSDGFPSARAVQTAWVVDHVVTGNSFTEPVGAGDWTPGWQWSRVGNTRQTTINGYTVTNNMDFRGAYVERATPSYMSMLIYNSSVPEGYEVLIVEAGDTGLPTDYNIDNQQGRNGNRLTNEQTAEKWISDIRIANRRLTVLDRGTDGQFLIQPANYDDTANFVLETAINSDDAGALRVWEMYASTLDTDNVDYSPLDYEGLMLKTSGNSRSAIPFRNSIGPGVEPLMFSRATNSQTPSPDNNDHTVIDLTDSQISPSSTRIPNRTRYDSDAELHNPIVRKEEDKIFDVDRPWPRAEVNFNKYFPLFAQNTILNETKNINKIVGADIGWSRPLFSYTRRTQRIRGTDLIIGGSADTETINTNVNDYPLAIRSSLFREFLPLSPEYEVESLKAMAMWVDGTYKPGFFENIRYNRLYTVTVGRDNPGEPDSTITARELSPNWFYVSQDYKSDHRSTGRFLTIYVSDNSDVFPRAVSEVDPETGTTFSQLSPWRLSGIQLEINKGGQR